MIISHKYKFIFLKTRKTAGTSIDIGLSACCGREDVIAPVNAYDEVLKIENGARTAQNYLVPWWHWTAQDYVRLAFRAKPIIYTEHMSAQSVRRRISRKVWNSYFKFCVERNPFDKAISLYYWRTRDQSQRPKFIDFLKDIDHISLSNFHMYSINGAVIVDDIIRYEELDDGLKRVTDRLGMGPLKLLDAKSSFRRDVNKNELMSVEAKRIIGEVCGREIELFDYKCD